ncbi:MAG: hypothetical protein M5U09_19080 [Gammaproteobacteria bacterium]|nr:hypothetical protein [Gammaproteobacteria bacterium]
MLGQLGLDRRQVIEQDLDHLVRLGLQALRLHCWDREISDHEGNLLDNEHLALLDYLIAAAKRRGDLHRADAHRLVGHWQRLPRVFNGLRHAPDDHRSRRPRRRSGGIWRSS